MQRLCAVENGWPVVGMLPNLVKNGLRIDHLFEKHGDVFVMNAGALGGKTVCFQAADDITEAQTIRQRDFESTVSGIVTSLNFSLCNPSQYDLEIQIFFPIQNPNSPNHLTRLVIPESHTPCWL